MISLRWITIATYVVVATMSVLLLLMIKDATLEKDWGMVCIFILILTVIVFLVLAFPFGPVLPEGLLCLFII